MDLGLNGKKVFITGSTRGIGLATAKGFLHEGASVVLNGRDEDRLEKVVNGLKKAYPGRIDGVAADITTPDGVNKAVSFVSDKFGVLDIFVGNLGNGKPESKNALEVTEWKRFYDVNVIGNLSILDKIHPLLKISSYASIVLISSIVAKQNASAPVGYAAAKQAVLVLTKYLSKQWASDGIRVNCVMPGNIKFKGGRWEELIEADPDGVKQYIESAVPMKKFGKPEEIADAILFLSSSRASFITGSALVVDGGQLDVV